MATQAAKSVKFHLIGSHRKTLMLLLCRHYSQNLSEFRLSKFSAFNFVGRAPPPLHLLLRPINIDLGLFSDKHAFQKLQRRKFVFQNDQLLPTARHISTNLDKAQVFDEKDRCSVFDQRGMLIKETTFGGAKLLASSQNSRLVYMSKNSDGLLCFSLQSLPVQSAESKSSISNTSNARKTDSKKAPKEYKIKASIADRDLKIKINQIQSHLKKGKQVVLFIKRASGSQASEKGGSELIQKVKEELGDLCCKFNQDYSNDTTTKLTLLPKMDNSSSPVNEESQAV